jgi:transposase
VFLKRDSTTINGKTYNHCKIVESYRQNGKPKHKVLFNLGDLPIEKINKIEMVLKSMTEKDLVDFDDVIVDEHRDFLDVALLNHFWQNWDFDKFFLEFRWTTSLVINRCICPKSKIQIKKWTTATTLPAIINRDFSQYDEYDIYRELEKINAVEDGLQKFIYKNLVQKNKIKEGFFYYDITSSYFEGSSCIISKLGYSRDHRADCKQIVIALMVTQEGYPFYWKVLEGNTTDITTVDSLLNNIKSTFGIKNCTLVFDRGMVSEDNIKLISISELEYISAVDSDEIKNNCYFKEAIPIALKEDKYVEMLEANGFKSIDTTKQKYYRHFSSENHRFIVYFDIFKYHNDVNTFNKRLIRMTEWISGKNITLANASKAVSEDSLKDQFKKILKTTHTKKLVEYTIVPIEKIKSLKNGKTRVVKTFFITFSVLIAPVQELRKIFGITCFISNSSAERLVPEEIINQYRSKNKVEEAFHEIKSFTNLRPILLTRADRVRAHVSICMMAYFLLNDIEVTLKSKEIDMSPQTLLENFKKCQANKLSVFGTTLKKFNITTPSQEQITLLNALSANHLIEKKFVNKLISKLT